MITPKERERLRQLAQTQLEVANSEKNQKRAQMWIDHNACRGQRPMIHLEIDNFTQEVLLPQMQCEDRRLFKKASGYSPYEYLLMARIDKAKYLLKATDIPIKNVAQQVGYLNASTFSSVFTTKVGLSPKAFRAKAA